MNVVFFGSDDFAVPSLRVLLATKHKVSCVVTQSDKKKGRHLHLATTAVKTVAQENSLDIYQPDNINTAEAIKLLKDLQPDLCVVIAYGQILSKDILNIPEIFAINVHASLLPKYRGAAPINWAIINGETTTGVTVIKMVKQMDAGPIIAGKITEIKEDDTCVTLGDRLSQVAADLLVETLASIENNNYKLTPQDESRVSFAPKLKKEDGLINWGKPAQDIYNLIRGCLDWPGAFTYYKGKLLKIYKASVCPSVRLSVCPLSGEIINISKEGIVVATGYDGLRIEELQIEGKRRMRVEEFIAGYKICAGEIFGWIKK